MKAINASCRSKGGHYAGLFQSVESVEGGGAGSFAMASIKQKLSTVMFGLVQHDLVVPINMGTRTVFKQGHPYFFVAGLCV